MSEINEIQDTLNLEDEDRQKLPSMLNVLTILTYIGCALGAISAIYSYFTVCKSVEKLTSGELPEMGGALGKMMDSAIELSQKQCENNLVITTTALVGISLCFAGALMMRALKKQGFVLYVCGELLAPLVSIIVLGSSVFGGMMLLGMLVPVIFVILYFTQYKFLIN